MSTLTRQEWFGTPLGRFLLEREQAYFDQTVADIFGFHALQLGLTEVDLLRSCRIAGRFTAASQGPVRLRTDLDYLPVASQSVDLLLLPHVLEFTDHPHQILREAERVLIPDGQLIISGFNPFSLWGIRRFFSAGSGDYPWGGRFFSLPRLKDWLALLGFEVVSGRLCCYAPPVHGEKWLQRLHFLEAAGDRWWALAGGVYFLQARKRVHGMRLIMPSWNEKMAAKALAPAAQKTVTQKIKDGA